MSRNQFWHKFSESVEKSLGLQILRPKRPPLFSQFWKLNEWFGGVPIVIFGSYFRRMHEIWFYKNFIIASRLYNLVENPRSLEAARGRGHFWHPETRGSHLSTIYGGQNDLSIDWPLAASSDLGFSMRLYSLEAEIKFLRNKILCILLKYELNLTIGTPPNHTFLINICIICGGRFGLKFDLSTLFATESENLCQNWFLDSRQSQFGVWGLCFYEGQKLV